jgi:hypothetical protein
VLWLELVDGVAAPRQVIAELGARLPACVLDERLLSLRAAEDGPLRDMVRRSGLVIYERAAAPARSRAPTMSQNELAEGTLSKRYTLVLVLEIDGSIPTGEFLRAAERRIVAWRADRAAKAKAVRIDVVVTPALHDAVAREVRAWAAPLDVQVEISAA